MLRGIAILLVLGRHYVVPHAALGSLQPIASFWVSIGWSGVDLFFVLSGFLVSGLLFAEYREHQKVNLRRFIIRRGFKIWPPYFAYIAFVSLWLAWKHWRGLGPGVLGQMWQNLLHVQNYFGTPRIHTWSLAVEEHFYIGIALLLGLIFASRRAKNYLRLLPPLIIATILGLAVLRQGAFLRDGPTQMNLYATHLRFDGLLIGMLLAYWTHFQPGKIARFTRCPFTLIFAGAGLAAPVLVLTPEANALAAGLGLTSLYIGFALILLGWINLPKAHAWASHWFAAGGAALLGQIGFYSYSIYLWHVDLAQTPISKIVGRMTAAHVPSGIVWVGATTTYVLMAIFAGMILSRLLEIPMLTIRDRLVPRSTNPILPPKKITASILEAELKAPPKATDGDVEPDVRRAAAQPTIVLVRAEQVQPSARYPRTLPS